MKALPISLALLGLILPVTGQEEADETNSTPRDEIASKWEVEIPEAIADGTPSKPIEKPAPIDFKIITSRTEKVDVVRAPEMHDLPPITGRINVTVQRVQDPELPESPEPLPTIDLEDPIVTAKMEELRQEYRGTSLVFISATVYDHSRTFLRIYPNGGIEGEVTAWSNLDLNHFSGFSTYRVKDGVDGTNYDYGMLMGLGNQDTVTLSKLDFGTDFKYEAPVIPELPDLSVGGPSFVVIEGNADGSAMATLEQIHDLYRKEGKQMEAAFHAREKARAERKAYLLANPPKPDDVTISFWKKSNRPAVAPTKTAQ